MYQERLQHFIQTGSQSKVVIDKWLNKIASLKAKKQKYEELFKKELNPLNDDFDVINLQFQELKIRLKKMENGEAWK